LGPTIYAALPTDSVECFEWSHDPCSQQPAAAADLLLLSISQCSKTTWRMSV